MTAQELKNSILQLAIQGKLVKQDPNDEPASVLLEKIKEEREKLIKEKKIKREKYSEIYKDSSDNHYYEKFKDGTINDITEEIPFDLPESWRWIHFGELFYTQSGLSYKKDNLAIKSDEMYTIFRGGNIGDGEYFYKGDDLQISEQFVKDNTILKKNCYITPSVTSIEHIGKIALIDNNLNKTVAGGFVLIVYPILENNDLLKYYLYALSSKYHKDNCKKITNKSGQAFYNLSREKLMQLLLPLPPIEEQKKITERIKLFLPFINNYNKINDKLETLNSNYKDELKKSILQYAIQGKLVKQDPNDESAEILINKILDEKRELIKTKQIKKEKLSVIYKDSTDNQFYEKFDDGKIINITEEIPFEIPNTWSWTRLGNILTKLSDGTHKTPKYTSDGIPFLSVKDMSSGKISFDNTKFISKEEHEILYQRCNPEKGDILLSKVGTTGVPVIVDTDKEFSLFVSLALLKFNVDFINKDYLRYLLLSPLVQKQCRENTKGVGNKNWVMKDIANTLIIIPNLNKQITLANKLDILFNYIETAE